MAASPFTPHCGSLRVGNGNLEIFYQNVRGLRTKSTEIFNTVCSFDYEIICLTETWLNESFSTQDFFPGTYTVYRSDRDCIDKLRGGGVLTAVSDTVFGIKRRPDLEFFHESVGLRLHYLMAVTCSLAITILHLILRLILLIIISIF